MGTIRGKADFWEKSTTGLVFVGLGVRLLFEEVVGFSGKRKTFPQIRTNIPDSNLLFTVHTLLEVFSLFLTWL